MLTNTQKRDLRRRSHSLKPVVMVGQNGVSEAVILEVDRALSDHELIKVRLRGIAREERAAQISEICEQLECDSVLSIGATVVLFRENPDKGA